MGPQRVVSTSLASDEILVALLSQNERGRIAALSSLAGDPKYSFIAKSDANGVPRFSQNLESLYKLKPDLIILSAFNKPAIKVWAQKQNVDYLELKTFSRVAHIKKHIRQIGTKLKKSEAAKKLIQSMENEIDDLKVDRKSKKPRILSLDSSMLSMGKNTLFHDMVSLAGGQNLAADMGIKEWQKVSREALATSRPDIIVVSGTAKDQSGALRWLSQSPLKNLKNPSIEKRICFVPSALLSSTSHHISKTIAQIHKCVRGWQNSFG